MAYGWTKEAEEYIVKNYGKVSQKDMALKLEKARSTIANKIRILQENDLLPKQTRSTRIPWTNKDQKYLEDNISKRTLMEIAVALEKPYTTIQGRAVKLKKANPEKYGYKPREIPKELTECPDCGSSKINNVQIEFQGAKYFCMNCLKEFDRYGKRVKPIL